MTSTIYQKTGRSHLLNDQKCQDAVLNSESFSAQIAVIADGVSLCRNSREGAEIACKAVSDIMLNETSYMFNSAKKKISALLLSYVYGKLLQKAAAVNEPVESFSSTLSFLCLNKISGEVMTFMLGDSLIYLINDGRMTVAGTPLLSSDEGVYSTTSGNAADKIDINLFCPSSDSSFLLATDGAWRTFYSGGSLSEEVIQAANKGNIIDYLEKQTCEDDCSIVLTGLLKGANS